MKPSDNPFRSSIIATQRYRIAPKAYAALLALIEQKKYRACLRGPHGTGKSTLLQDIATTFEQEGKVVCWYYINRQMSWSEKRQALKGILLSDSQQVNFLDGGEALGYLVWISFLVLLRLKGKSLLATTHIVSPLPTLYKTQIDEGVMLGITKALAGTHWSIELQQLALSTYAKNGGNYREVLRACYLYCGELEVNHRLS